MTRKQTKSKHLLAYSTIIVTLVALMAIGYVIMSEPEKTHESLPVAFELHTYKITWYILWEDPRDGTLAWMSDTVSGLQNWIVQYYNAGMMSKSTKDALQSQLSESLPVATYLKVFVTSPELPPESAKVTWADGTSTLYQASAGGG